MRAHRNFVLQRGRWAISAYEDRNEDGVLNIGLFGPKEPIGFWRPFRGRHKPHFDEVAAMVDHNISEASLILRRSTYSSGSKKCPLACHSNVWDLEVHHLKEEGP